MIHVAGDIHWPELSYDFVFYSLSTLIWCSSNLFHIFWEKAMMEEHLTKKVDSLSPEIQPQSFTHTSVLC